MNTKITVLMSTYNGEKYLREQIDSVLNQVDVDVHLEIRDDGSSDNTVRIIEEYVSKNPHIVLYKGENVGPIKSFFALLQTAPESDYYAFCDQDDYWEKDKLVSAINALLQYDKNTPNMYCSNLKVVDENLDFCRMCHNKPFKVDRRYLALADFFAVGCTEVFNKKALEVIKSHQSESCLMHDNWLFLICNFFGKVIYDFDAHIKYRQHGNNVIGSRKSELEKIKDRINRAKDSNIQPRLSNAIALMDEFSCELSEEDKKKINKIISYKKSMFNTLKLFFDSDICANDIWRDLRYRLLILTRRI